MMTPIAIARTTPVNTSIGIAMPGRSFLNGQPVRAPVPAATGTAITLQKTPAIGQMLDFIASGTTKHVIKAHAA